MSNSVKIYRYLTVKNNDIKVKSMQHFSKISLLTLVLLHFSAYSIDISSYDCNISSGKEFIMSGTIKGINSVTLRASSIIGNGIIESPNITIICNEFKFSGLISCDKQCTIYVKKNFDINMFKREGEGTFKIIISPYNVEHFSPSDLSAAYYNYFCSKSLYLKQNAIDNAIKDIRRHAAFNFIDDKAVLRDIKEKLESEVEQTKYWDLIYSGLDKSWVTATGLGIAYVLFENEQYLADKLSVDSECMKYLPILLASVSIFPLAYFGYDFYNWDDPQYHTKYDGLSLIINRIEHALMIERIPEEKIITL